MRRTLVIALIAVIHFALVVTLAAATFEVSGFMFGVYPKPAEGLGHDALTTAYTVLMAPFGLVAESLGPDKQFIAWPLMVLNSLMWAVVVYLLVARLFMGRRGDRAS